MEIQAAAMEVKCVGLFPIASIHPEAGVEAAAESEMVARPLAVLAALEEASARLWAVHGRREPAPNSTYLVKHLLLCLGCAFKDDQSIKHRVQDKSTDARLY